MRRYETIFIIDPDVSEDLRKPILTRVNDQIQKEGGFPVIFDEWGNRKLAYDIKKKQRGYYVLVDFCGTNAMVDEMERFFRIDDKILKYMTVLLDREPDIEKIKEEIEAKAEAEAAKTVKVSDQEASPEPSAPETTETDEPVAESETVEAETTQPDTDEEE